MILYRFTLMRQNNFGIHPRIVWVLQESLCPQLCLASCADRFRSLWGLKIQATGIFSKFLCGFRNANSLPILTATAMKRFAWEMRHSFHYFAIKLAPKADKHTCRTCSFFIGLA